MSGAADKRPLLGVRGLAKRYGAQVGCLDVGFDWVGEVLGIVGGRVGQDHRLNFSPERARRRGPGVT